MADLLTLKRIYLIRARIGTTNGTVAAQVAWLENLLVNGGSTGTGDRLTAGGWEITSMSSDGRSHSGRMLANDEDRSAAIFQAMDELRGSSGGGGLSFDFRTFHG